MTTRQLRFRPQDKRLLQSDNPMHPSLQKLLTGRAIESLADVHYSLDQMLAPGVIRNIDAASDLLAQQLQGGKSILVFGDYDADGATSTALCMRALTMMGAQSPAFLMPDRFLDGYGLSAPIARRIIDLAPDCVITVDNGIASLDGIAALRAQQIEVIVTDHHLPASSLPDASVILNQNAWPDETQGRNLAGVGVVFYLMLALRSRLRESGWFDETRPEPNLADCLDLVAIGTIADLVPLDFNNRLLVSEGLKRIRAGHCSAGIAALCEVAGKPLEYLCSSDIGFAIAPRINAAGRLEDISIGVRCLLADRQHQAHLLAQQLEQINSERKQIQQQMSAEASAIMATLDGAEIDASHAIVLFHPDWHEGLVGIIAARIRESYHRPSIVFAAGETGILKGSGRSIDGIHLRDTLDWVDKNYPGLIDKFGGHAMAAGLSLAADRLAEFEMAFKLAVSTIAGGESFDEVIECDGELEDDCHNLEFALQLQALSPWGQHFPVPSFVGEFEVVEQRVLAGKHLKLQLTRAGKGFADVEAIAFFQPEPLLQQQFEKLRIHYQLDVNRFRGQQTLQLLVQHILDEDANSVVE